MDSEDDEETDDERESVKKEQKHSLIKSKAKKSGKGATSKNSNHIGKTSSKENDTEEDIFKVGGDERK
jgi:hypothetical protein